MSNVLVIKEEELKDTKVIIELAGKKYDFDLYEVFLTLSNEGVATKEGLEKKGFGIDKSKTAKIVNRITQAIGIPDDVSFAAKMKVVFFLYKTIKEQEILEEVQSLKKDFMPVTD